MAALRVAIVGAGAAGSALALLLARAGHEVHLFEAVAQPEPVGAGVLVQPTGQWVLDRLGLLDSVQAHAARVTALYGDRPDGRAVLTMNYDDHDAAAYGLGVQRGTLMGVLWQAQRESSVAWHCGQPVDGFEQRAGGVGLHGAQAHGRFDLLVLANGSFSRLRQAMRVQQREAMFPWGALWCVLDAPPEPRLDLLRQRYRAAREMIGLMPVGHAYRGTPQPGAGSREGTTLFWSLPQPALAAWQQRPDLAALKRSIGELLPLAAPWLAALQSPEQLRVARYADVWMPGWHDERVVAIGDCAHGMSPQLGQGVNLALVDAWVLSRALAGTPAAAVPAALARYSRQRRRHLHYYQHASRWITPLFQSSGRVAPVLRDTLLAASRWVPYARAQSAAALAGVKTGWLAGRLRLDDSP